VSWLDRFSNLFRRENVGQELDEELQFHLDARTRANLNAGMTAKEAQHDAQRRFGNATLAKERAHEMNIVMSIETIGRDLRYALRSLCKSAGFTVVATLTLALGFGANIAVFTVVNGVLFRPLPFPNPGRLFLISYQSREGGLGLFDRDYLEYQQHVQTFEQIATFNDDSITLTGAGDAVRLPTADVTSSFFSVLEVNPAMGRAFLPAEEKHGSNRVVLLSDKIWKSRFGADVNCTCATELASFVKRQLRCAPSAARVIAPRFLMNEISTSRFASGDAKIVLLPSRPGKLPPPRRRADSART